MELCMPYSSSSSSICQIPTPPALLSLVCHISAPQILHATFKLIKLHGAPHAKFWFLKLCIKNSISSSSTELSMLNSNSSIRKELFRPKSFACQIPAPWAPHAKFQLPKLCRATHDKFQLLKPHGALHAEFWLCMPNLNSSSSFPLYNNSSVPLSELLAYLWGIISWCSLLPSIPGNPNS